MPETKALCVLDIGTTGVRAALVSDSLTLLTSARRDYNILYAAGGVAEQEPEEMWNGICAVTRRVMAFAGDRGIAVRAVAGTYQRASILAVDERWRPLTNLMLWMDQRGRSEILEAVSAGPGATRFREITGLPVDPMTSLAKLLWLRGHRPRVFEGAHRFVGLQPWVLSRLGCEEPPWDPSCASWTGLFDVDKRGWSPELLSAAGLSVGRFGPLADSSGPVGRVSASASRETGLPEGTLMVAGGGDQQCSSVGGGVTEYGSATVNFGTSAVFMTPRPEAWSDPSGGFITAAHVLAGGTEVEGTVPASGSVMRWLARVLRFPDGPERYEAMNGEASRSPLGAGGLAFVPAMAGLGTPYWREASGVMLGLSLQHDRGDLVRAAIEGILYQTKDMLEYAASVGLAVDEVRAVGGGARSSLWCQLLADIANMPVSQVFDPQSAPLMGAALCAFVGLEAETTVAEAAANRVRVVRGFEPSSNGAAYEEHYRRYRDLLAEHVGVQSLIPDAGGRTL
jgi:xylulokinase